MRGLKTLLFAIALVGLLVMSSTGASAWHDCYYGCGYGGYDYGYSNDYYYGYGGYDYYSYRSYDYYRPTYSYGYSYSYRPVYYSGWSYGGWGYRSPWY